MTDADVIAFEDRARACLLGGLIGDAMGSPAENLEPEEISAAYGWVESVHHPGTDDSILKHLLCDALLATAGRATASDWAVQWVSQGSVFRGEARGRFFVSVLQTATKLAIGYSPATAAVGNLASSSSAMGIAPVGIVKAGDPVAARDQARELASLIHRDDVAFCQEAAGAVAASIAVAMVGGDTDAVLAAAVSSADPTGVMYPVIVRALELARRSDYVAFRAAYHDAFRRPLACDPRETVPAALALVRLSDGDPRQAIPLAANFGRDTDTIATMAGSICGAMAGTRALDPAWIDAVESMTDRDQRELATALSAISHRSRD